MSPLGLQLHAAGRAFQHDRPPPGAVGPLVWQDGKPGPLFCFEQSRLQVRLRSLASTSRSASSALAAFPVGRHGRSVRRFAGEPAAPGASIAATGPPLPRELSRVPRHAVRCLGRLEFPGRRLGQPGQRLLPWDLRVAAPLRPASGAAVPRSAWSGPNRQSPGGRPRLIAIAPPAAGRPRPVPRVVPDVGAAWR